MTDTRRPTPQVTIRSGDGFMRITVTLCLLTFVYAVGQITGWIPYIGVETLGVIVLAAAITAGALPPIVRWVRPRSQQ